MSDDSEDHRAPLVQGDVIHKLRAELAALRTRAEKAEHERDAALERIRLGRKPITKDSAGYCPGTCEYRELTRDISALMVARDTAEAQVGVMAQFIREIVAIDPLCGGGPTKYFVTGDFIKKAIELLSQLNGAPRDE